MDSSCTLHWQGRKQGSCALHAHHTRSLPQGLHGTCTQTPVCPWHCLLRGRASPCAGSARHVTLAKEGEGNARGSWHCQRCGCRAARGKGKGRRLCSLCSAQHGVQGGRGKGREGYTAPGRKVSNDFHPAGAGGVGAGGWAERAGMRQWGHREGRWGWACCHCCHTLCHAPSSVCAAAAVAV